MQIPLTVKRPLESAEKRIAQLLRGRSRGQFAQSHGEFERELQEIAEALSHSLDRLMSFMWDICIGEKYKPRPNIYWPDTESLEGFNLRMRQLQLGELEQTNPSAYEIIIETQRFGKSKATWCSDLKHIANLKHERDARVAHKIQSESVTIGKGNRIQIEELRFNEGELSVKGYEEDGGKRRPLTVHRSLTIRQELERVGRDPLEFYGICLIEIRSMAYRLVNAIG